MPSPIQPTGANLRSTPLQPTDGADSGDRSANGNPMLVRCSHRSREPETESRRTEPIYNFQRFGYDIVSPSIYFYFFNKTSSYWVLLKKKRKKNRCRFSDFCINSLSLSVKTLSRLSPLRFLPISKTLSRLSLLASCRTESLTPCLGWPLQQPAGAHQSPAHRGKPPVSH